MFFFLHWVMPYSVFDSLFSNQFATTMSLLNLRLP